MPDSVSGLTKNEIITAAIFPLGYSSSDNTGDLETQLSVLFDETLIDFCGRNDWRFLHTSTTLSLSISTRTYNFQTNSIYVDDIEKIIITTTGKSGEMRRTNYQDIFLADPESTKSGTPKFYAWWGEQTIYFDSTLDETLGATLLYRQIVPMVTSGSSYPLVPRRLQRCLIDGLRWRFLQDKGDSRAAGFAQAYEKSIADAVYKEHTRLDSGDERIKQEGERVGLGVIPTMQDVLARYYW